MNETTIAEENETTLAEGADIGGSAPTKLLTTAEIEAKLEETRQRLIQAIDSGDLETYRALSIDQNFYIESMKVAEKREADAEYARLRAEKDALRPEAEALAAAAHPDVVYAPFLGAIEKAVTDIVAAAAALPKMHDEAEKASTRAAEVCPKAGVAFQPAVMRGNWIHQYAQKRAREVIVRELRRVDALQGAPFAPTLNFIL